MKKTSNLSHLDSSAMRKVEGGGLINIEETGITCMGPIYRVTIGPLQFEVIVPNS